MKAAEMRKCSRLEDVQMDELDLRGDHRGTQLLSKVSSKTARAVLSVSLMM